MKKFLSAIVETIFWLQYFITPLVIGGLIAIFIYISNEKLLWLSIVITIISAIIGFLFAERVRKKHGLSRYASRRIATPDIWPDEYPEEIEAREKERQKREAKKRIKIE